MLIYKWAEILCLEIDIFELKMMVKNGIYFFYFEIQWVPLEIPASASRPGQFSPSEQIVLHWAAATLKEFAEFQNRKF